jgi:hypothetical protein
MSTHVLDASGARPLSTTVNDPAATRASVTAKGGDDVRFQIGGVREVRIGLPESARIERRRHVTKSQRLVEGKVVRGDDGEFIYDEREYDSYYLVLGGGVSVFARSSYTDDQASEAREQHPEGSTLYEPTPHTTMWVKRNGDALDLSEQGVLIEDVELREVLPKALASLEEELGA